MKASYIVVLLVVCLFSLEGHAAKAGYGWDGTDTDKDGKISLEEHLVAGRIRKQAEGKQLNKEPATKFFRVKDKDGDGFLDQAEFKAPIAKGWDKPSAVPTKPVAPAKTVVSKKGAVKAGYGWDGTDTNKDGKISMEENMAAGRIRKEAAGGKLNVEFATKFFKAKDKDGDGFLNKAEHKANPPKGWNK